MAAIDAVLVAGATRVWDEARGGWVARFVAANKQDLNGEVGSTAEMYGNSDYTLSVWAKPSASCPSQASFLSFGKKNDTAYQEIQFRFQDFSTRKLVLAHWGSSHDFTGIPSTSASPVGEWHHYVAVREGATYRVYVDGEQDDTISAFVRKKANSETEYTIVLDGKQGLRLIIR